MFELEFNANTLALAVLCIMIAISMSWLGSLVIKTAELDEREKKFKELFDSFAVDVKNIGPSISLSMDELLHIHRTNEDLKVLIGFQKAVTPSSDGKDRFNKTNFPNCDIFHLSLVSLEENGQDFMCNPKLTYVYNRDSLNLCLYDDTGALLLCKKMEYGFDPYVVFKLKNTPSVN